MSGSWGADFGAGLWGALDREAQDFQQRRKARKEEERRKRLAEEERLRQEALANQRAENLFEMNNQSMEPMYAATGMAGMTPYVSGAIQKVFDQAGANGSTVGGIMNAQQDILNKKAYDDQQKKEEQERELNDYNQKIRNFNLWKNENAMHEYEELQALKPELERKKQEEEALKKKWDLEEHNARMANMASQTRYHNAQANYWNNGGRSAESRGNGKDQEQIDPEEKKFYDNDKAYDKQIKDLNNQIATERNRASIYEKQGKFDKADAANQRAEALADKIASIRTEKDKNLSNYQKWKNNKEKPAAKTSSAKIRDVVDTFKNIGIGIKDNLMRRTGLNKLQTKIEEDFYKGEEEKKEKKKLEEEMKRKQQEDLMIQEARKIQQDRVNESLKQKVPASYDYPIVRDIWKALATSDGHLSNKEAKALRKKHLG